MGPKKKRKTNDQEGIVYDETSNESITNVSENNAALLQFLSDNPEKNEEVIENSDNGVTTVTKTIIRYKTRGIGYEVQQLKRKQFDHQKQITTLRILRMFQMIHIFVMDLKTSMVIFVVLYQLGRRRDMINKVYLLMLRKDLVCLLSLLQQHLPENVLHHVLQ